MVAGVLTKPLPERQQREPLPKTPEQAESMRPVMEELRQQMESGGPGDLDPGELVFSARHQPGMIFPPVEHKCLAFHDRHPRNFRLSHFQRSL